MKDDQGKPKKTDLGMTDLVKKLEKEKKVAQEKKIYLEKKGKMRKVAKEKRRDLVNERERTFSKWIENLSPCHHF